MRSWQEWAITVAVVAPSLICWPALLKLNCGGPSSRSLSRISTLCWLRPPRLAPLGVLLFSAVGLYGLATGYHFLDYAALDPEDPAHGQHLGLLLIEFGVGVTVAATMLLLFYTFTSRRPPR